MRKRVQLIICILFLSSTMPLTAEETIDIAPLEIKPFEETDLMTPDVPIQYLKSEVDFRFLQEKNRLYLIFAVMAVTPLFLLIILFFISKCKPYSAENIVNGSGLVLIIQATLLVVIAAPTTEQLTSAIGIIGAIAGYLFGTARQSRKSPTKRKVDTTEID